jgi:MFS family permease
MLAVPLTWLGQSLFLGRWFNKNVHILFLCQALANTGTSLVVTMTALAAGTIAEDQALVTLPLALQYVAMMATSSVASFLMRRIGRRGGFTVASVMLMSAGLLAAYALTLHSFALYCLASLLLGSCNAFAMYYRFTAVEVTPEPQRGRAISYVMAGGVVAALFGPRLAVLARDLLAPTLFAGGFVAVSGLAFAAFLALRFLDVPRLTPAEQRVSGRPLGRIARQPAFIVALFGAAIAFASMNVVMTSTPLAMTACGLAFGDTAEVIQWHVLGMYAPAFFMGGVVQRFGALKVMTAGVLLMLASIGINLAGVAFVNFWAALLLVGVGWSCLFIGATTLLTQTYRPEERSKVQALNDTAMFTLVAIGALGSGALQQLFGWNVVNLTILPGLLLVAAAILWLRLRQARLPLAAL